MPLNRGREAKQEESSETVARRPIKGGRNLYIPISRRSSSRKWKVLVLYKQAQATMLGGKISIGGEISIERCAKSHPQPISNSFPQFLIFTGLPRHRRMGLQFACKHLCTVRANLEILAIVLVQYFSNIPSVIVFCESHLEDMGKPRPL